MKDEVVDIVDENDQVLYKITKQEAHAKGLLHRCVIAEIINSKGEWLLVKQASDRQDPGQFVSPIGGHVSSGEKSEQALKREANEEGGYKNIKFRFKKKAVYRRPWKIGVEHHYFMVYEIYTDSNPKLNAESVDFKWFKPEEIKTIMKDNPSFFGYAFHFVYKYIYKEFKEG